MLLPLLLSGRSDWANTLLVLAVFFVLLLMAITVHEFSHAATALALGDDTAKQQGRVSLNPLAHLDPAGTLMILVVGFGWGKPVPFSPWRFRANPRLSSSLVALAGPAANLVTAVVLGLLLRSATDPFQLRFDPSKFEIALLLLIRTSLALGFFNLIPVFPLDGFNVLRGLLPPKLGDAFARLSAWGPGILFLLIGIGLFTKFNPISQVLSPIVGGAMRLIVGSNPF